MNRLVVKFLLMLGLMAAGLAWNGDLRPASMGLLSTAEAVVGAPGVGVAPGNLGGPVNRVGVR